MVCSKKFQGGLGFKGRLSSFINFTTHDTTTKAWRSSKPPHMSSSASETKTSATSKTQETETPSTSNPPLHPETKTQEDKKTEVSDRLNASSDGEDGEGEGEEDEEEGECGFCLFMKGGGCRETFIAWEKCIEDAEKNKEDIVEKCFEVTGLLKTCMNAHADYYEPILRAEKAAEEEAIKELERESASKEKQEN